MPTRIDGAVLIHAGSDDSGAWQRIGAWDGSGWADLADDAQGPAVSFDSVSVASVDLAASASDIAFSTSEYECVESPLHTGLLPHVTLPEPLLDDGYQAVAVAANWRLQPRSVTQVGLDAEVYQEVGESLLAGRPGVDPSNGDVVQVVRADLDGDGLEEVLVAFRDVSEPNFGAPGDFSIVYARFPRSDGTVDDLIVSEHLAEEVLSGPPFGRLSVSAVADLNGDGAMEVAIGLSLWEFTGIEIYESQGAGLVRVMSGGCGS